MTINKLINSLSKYPGNLEVVMNKGSDFEDIRSVSRIVPGHLYGSPCGSSFVGKDNLDKDVEIDSVRLG